MTASPVTTAHALLRWLVLAQGMTVADFKKFIAVDKKVLDGRLRLILLKGALGGCVFTGDFQLAVLEEVLAAYC